MRNIAELELMRKQEQETMSTDAPFVADFEITDETMKAITTPDEPDRVINLAERQAKLIPISQIATPKKDQWSSFNKKAALEITDTILAKGMMVPILLRPLPKSPTQVTSNGTEYEIVAGRQRFYAVTEGMEIKNKPRWINIPAIIAPMDDEDCKMYCLIENCARKTLNQDQLYAHINTWRKLHAAKVGASDPMDLRRGRKEAAAKARAAKKAQKPVDGTEGILEREGAARDEAKQAKSTNLQQAIAHATGTSVSTAKRTMRVATMLDGLTDVERSVIFSEDDDKHPTKEQLEKLADLTTKSITDTIKLVASGMVWDEAISLGNRKPGRKPDPEKPASIDELDDEEWLEATCSERLSTLKKKINFRSDAVLYRKFVGLRKKIQKDIENLLKATKEAGHRGPFHEMIEKTFRVKFPNEWLICGMCGGKGKSMVNGEDGPSCNQCRGCGYRVQSESL